MDLASFPGHTPYERVAWYLVSYPDYAHFHGRASGDIVQDPQSSLKVLVQNQLPVFYGIVTVYVLLHENHVTIVTHINHS